LFEKSTRGRWVASFRLCQSGRYTAHVRLISLDPYEGFMPTPSSSRIEPTAVIARRRQVPAFAQRCTLHQTPAGLVLKRHEFILSPSHASVDPCSACLWGWAREQGTGRVGLSRLKVSPRESLSDLADTPHKFTRTVGMARAFRDLSFGVEWDGSGRDASLAWWRRQIRDTEPTSPPTGESRGLPLCLLGDSHLRNLGNSLILAASNTSVGANAGCDPESIQQNKSLCAASRHGKQLLRHFMVTRTTAALQSAAQGTVWAQNSRENSTRKIVFYSGESIRTSYKNVLKDGCGAILMGYGHWGLSYQQWIAANRPKGVHVHGRGRGPVTLPEYTADVTHAMQWLRSFCDRKRLPCAWIAAMPAPLALTQGHRKTTGASLFTNQITCPPREWRLPHLIHQLNLAARAAAATYATDYIDTWPVALPLLDTSFDGIHYQAPIAPAVASAVVHWLWSKTHSQHIR